MISLYYQRGGKWGSCNLNIIKRYEMADPTQQQLKEIFKFNSNTGEFLRLNRKGKVGTMSSGYLRIYLLGSSMYAHRLAWIYCYGKSPGVIDHIDGNPLNNKISNLRDVTTSINAKNQKLSKSNKSGVCGVRFATASNAWIATVWANGDTRHLKLSKDFFEAVCARKSYDAKNGFTQRHGMA